MRNTAPTHSLGKGSFMNKSHSFGPQTGELTEFLQRFTDPINKDAVEVVQARLRARIQVPNYPEVRAQYFSDAHSLTELARKKHRLRPLKALWSSEYISFIPPSLHASLGALAMKDLVGKGWLTEARYSRLMELLVEFTTIVDSAPPGSPKRDILCGLLVNGASMQDALRTADGALAL